MSIYYNLWNYYNKIVWPLLQLFLEYNDMFKEYNMECFEMCATHTTVMDWKQSSIQINTELYLGYEYMLHTVHLCLIIYTEITTGHNHSTK